MNQFRAENGVLLEYYGEDEEFVVPSWITTIGREAFSSAGRTLKRVVLSDKVVTIQNAAFNCCRALESVVLPEGLVTIEEGAFFFCAALKEIKLPASLKTIGNNVFRCSGLEHIEIPAGVTSIGTGVFANCDHLATAKLPKRFKGGLFKNGLKKIFAGELEVPEKSSKHYKEWLKNAKERQKVREELYRKVDITLY